MNFSRIGWGILLLIGSTGAPAQPPPTLPANALPEAVKQLFAAGNYSWRESRQAVFNDRKSDSPYGVGVTVINGFTLATVIEPHNLRAAFYGPRTAFELKDGWRRTLDFTDEEFAYVFRIPASLLEAHPTIREAYRKHTHALFHDVLRHLLQAATNIREEDGALVGDIADRGLEMFIATGRAPPEFRSILPGLIPPPTRRPLSGVKEESGIFHLWLADGKISKCAIDFSRSGVMSRGEYAGKEFSTQRVYIYEITEIGTTSVDITPELAVAFNDVTVAR